jgi:hypothetical protein
MLPRQPYGFPQAARNDYMAEGGASEGCECELITVRLTKSSAAQYLTDVTCGSDRHVPLRSSPGRRTKGALGALLTVAYTGGLSSAGVPFDGVEVVRRPHQYALLIGGEGGTGPINRIVGPGFEMGAGDLRPQNAPLAIIGLEEHDGSAPRPTKTDGSILI